MADMFQVLCGFAAVFLALYYYYTSTFHFWKDSNIRGPRPTAFIGNFANLLFRTKSVSEQLTEWYKEYKDEPAFGLYEGRSPVLVINDLDMVKSVLIGDFSQFVNRGFRIFPEIERLTQHLFSLEAERWRPLRAKLSPVFTSGKLKEMFPLMLECSEDLNKYLSKTTETCDIIDCKDLAGKFTTDVIGSCVFGISMNALSNEGSEFRRIGKEIFRTTPRTLLRDAVRQFVPTLYGLIGGHLQSVEIEEFFINVITNTIKYRREHKVVRPDFIHMLMELQDHPEKIDNIEMTNSMLTSQAFVFFVAGFETSSSTISHALYELAQNHDIQEKLRQEIKDAYGDSNKTLTYDQIKGMTYLDKVFKETLRKYPLLAMLTRQAMQNYTFKGTKLTIPKDTVVWIPVAGLQTDPNVYPKPDVFDPERFNEEIFASRHPMSYLPFGDGPRNCIGARFANYQSKLGIISIIRDFKVDVCEKTIIPYKIDPYSFVTTMKESYLRVTKIET